MKRFADSIARQKGIRPPAGYTKSGTICRAFLDQHARKKADGALSGELCSKPASPAQISLAEKIARERGIVIPDESKTNSAAISAWIKSHLITKRSKGRLKFARKPTKATVPKSPAAAKRSRTDKSDAVVTAQIPARPGNSPAAAEHPDKSGREQLSRGIRYEVKSTDLREH